MNQPTPETSEISLKEMYERIVTLETKVDLIMQSSQQSMKQFRSTVVIIVALQIIAIAIAWVK